LVKYNGHEPLFFISREQQLPGSSNKTAIFENGSRISYMLKFIHHSPTLSLRDDNG